MEIFTVSKDGTLAINMPVVRSMKEFNDIIKTRMVDNKEDLNGSLKVMNFKALLFVFYMAEWRKTNPLAAFPEQERIVKAKEEAGISPDWKPNMMIQAAIDKYIKIMTQYSPNARTLIGLKRGLMQTGHQIEISVEQNQQIVDAIAVMTKSVFADTGSEDFTKKLLSLQDMNKVFRDNTEYLLGITKKLDIAMESLDEMEKRVQEDFNKATEIIGGGKIGNRELPREKR